LPGVPSEPLAIPPAVLSAYRFEHDVLTPITVGLINQTYRVERRGRPLAILQRLHPIFDATVNDDLEVVARHLASRGLTTPHLIRTIEGQSHVQSEGVWRALTYVDGRTLTEVSSPVVARAAGVLAGRFTRALEDLHHTFQFSRVGVHDTPAHLAGLENAITDDAEGRPLAEAILEHARGLPPLPATRRRIVHGDLKITNLLFEPKRDVGLAAVDLDTLAHGTFPVELGDALRSWCNPAGESREGGIAVELFEAALMGLRESGVALDPDERESIVLGLETITTELASRFCRDVFEDRYFGWDSRRYPSRRAHCLARARSQLTLARSIRERRAELEAIARR
jgi:Ser/Thr protein kinase RdoA (MazF antagonist)